MGTIIEDSKGDTRSLDYGTYRVWGLGCRGLGFKVQGFQFGRLSVYGNDKASPNLWFSTCAKDIDNSESARNLVYDYVPVFFETPHVCMSVGRYACR